MDMVGGSAQSAVDSLLGRLSTVFVEEAQLLRNVHGDMQFIKREMESMNGFLLDADDDGRANGNQVRVWRRHVHELAYDSQSSVDRYVQTFGAAHPYAGAGLLASFRRAPELVRTLPARHRIATEIKGLKARAIEVADRRQRYGVLTLPAGGVALAARRAAPPVANEEADRRRALDSADVLFDVDTRAKELLAWLLGKPPSAVPRGRLRRNQLVTSGQLIKRLLTGGGGPHGREDLAMELIKLFRGLYGNDNPENVVEAAGYLREAMLEVGKQEVKVIGSWMLDKLLGRADMDPEDSASSSAAAPKKKDEAASRLVTEIAMAVKDPMAKFLDHSENLSSLSMRAWKEVIRDLLNVFKALKEPLDKFISHSVEQPPQAKDKDDTQARRANEDLLEMIKAAKEPMEVARAEGRYVAAQLRWLLHMFKDDFLEEHVKHEGRRPRVIAIVTPPVDGINDDDGEEPEELVEEMHATELARKVYNHPSASSQFDTKVWVNAKHNSQLQQRLKSILHQVLLPSPASNDDSREPTEAEQSKWKDWNVKKLKSEICECLKGKKFLMVLADPEDENSWLDITSALPNHGESAVIVTPKIKYMAQFDGWYTASWFFLLMGASARYHVHFCSNLVGLRKVAAQVVGSEQLQGGISAILKKCLWDSYATKMFLHALYANPHRSDAELDRLMHGLRYANSMGNARRMVRFCFDDLPKQYQSCLLCLSLFPQGNFKRASLVRRWAAENFVSARDGKTAVDEADRCFDALVARGLFKPVDVGPVGKVKSCTLDPHVLSFIKKMARRDGIIDNTDLPPDLAHRLSTRGGVLQILLENQAAADSNTCCCWGMMYGHRRTSTTSGDLSHQVVTLLNSMPASSDQLGLVKLLDLEGCTGLKKRSLKKICDKIFQLKYLSIRNTDATELPKEINKLRYLETLDIRQTKIRSFPGNTIALPKLMHLLAGRTDQESSEATGSDKAFSTIRLPCKIAGMTNMHVLSHVEVSKSDEDEFDNVGRKLHLTKLGVVIRGGHPLSVLRRVVGMLHETLCSLSVHLEQGQGADSKEEEGDGGHGFVLDPSEIPKSLESLNIKGKINELPTWIKQLHRLSKITLCRTKLIGEDIRRLGELANLRCVRLWHHSYSEEKLTFQKCEFRKLEFLIIEDSCISNIHFEENAAPRLNKIVWSFTGTEVTLSGIQKLQNLKEIHISGSCDKTHSSKIKEDANKNPNFPKVTLIDEMGVVAATNAATTASDVATGGGVAATNVATTVSDVATSGGADSTNAATTASDVATGVGASTPVSDVTTGVDAATPVSDVATGVGAATGAVTTISDVATGGVAATDAAIAASNVATVSAATKSAIADFDAATGTANVASTNASASK